MLQSIFSYIDTGIRKIRGNPQLIYTVTIALIIVGAFVFMASRFIGIANDAQERLINVRVGSLQDAFVSFAADRMNDPPYLSARIAEVSSENQTIRTFRVITRQEVFTDATTSAYVIIASNDPAEVGHIDPQADLLYSLAAGDPSHSVTTELNAGSGRLFNTARAIIGPYRNVLGVVMTTQTLSEADTAIQNKITESMYLLVGVIILILFLFFRHSRIIDYMDLYKQLTEIDHLKDDFISMASHELRSPLTVIRGYVEYLGSAPELSAQSKDFVSKIELSSKSLEALIVDMLDVSRIEQGRITFKMETFDPKDIIADVVISFDMLAKSKGLSLSFDTSRADSSQAISADKDRLRQVLVNLVGNAVKYTQQGSVLVSQYADNERVYIRVGDTGMGISAAAREKLFQKFYRVKTKETEAITGTGLGLWITAQLVKEMRGTISVESIEGTGSHFIVSFPRKTS